MLTREPCFTQAMHQIQLTSVAVYYALHSFLVEASRRQQHVDRKEKNEDE